MSETHAEGILTREELDALLNEVTARPEGRRSTRPFRGTPSPPPRAGRLAPLLRSLEEFAEEESRSLSTLHQTPIRFSLCDWEELTPRELATALIETDRIASLEFEPGAQRGYLVLGRALVFGWMSLAFGSQPGRVGECVPGRSYTRIEERFLRRALAELVPQLEKCWQLRHPVRAHVTGLQEPEAVAEDDATKLLGVSFHVEGLGELSRMRLALPPEAFGAVEQEAPQRPKASGMDGSLLETPVRVRVEAGSAELSLADIGRLKPGDVIPLERAEASGLRVCIEEQGKFRAERGSVAGRLAVQITGRL